ncbi:hypothetical protein DFP72DRAFT_1179008 [Ephemerocybe angulata]|uniref:F-box domain-containing protein n=1 Tax=Ephemerocybe angulata TaxID=980116 RepID=A0A8H6H986_9AGAR|nr:hypothetical protein DFP72DRAFT_1179008 [Tulosesus angulatus]
MSDVRSLPQLPLPFELLSAACSFLSLHDLYVLARTSSVLRAAANDTLYKNIAIHTNSAPVHFIQKLAAEPPLARLVRTCRIVVGLEDTVTPQPSLAYAEIASALSNMSGLTSLSLFAPVCHGGEILKTGPGAFFPQLRQLQASFPFGQIMIDFLSKTPGLESLVLDQSRADLTLEIPHTLLPRLSTISGPGRLSQVLVPGRPVSSISITSERLSEDMVSVLAASAGRVTTLSADMSGPLLPILEALAVMMPELEVIRLDTANEFCGQFCYTVRRTGFMEQVKISLNSMHRLKSAEISSLRWRWGGSLDDRDRRVLLNEPVFWPLGARHEEEGCDDCYPY